jgi:hypothetical protein
VVVSRDFGEFGMAQDFLFDLSDLSDQAKGVDLDWRVPPQLSSLNPQVGPFITKPYASGDEIIDALTAQPPAALLLFSGHLLVPDGILGLSGLRRLVRAAARLGVPVITSDPFLGLMRDFRLNDMVVDAMPEHRSASGLRQWRIRLSTFVKCRAISRVLSGARVVAPFPAAPGAPAVHGYFQPSADTGPPARHWVFVIADFDLRIQLAAHGEAGFTRHLLQRLQDGAGHGREVTLVAPAALGERLQGRVGPGVRLAPPLGIQAFRRLLGSAERVFYWNMVSHSLYQRLVQGSPVHFFDRGHVARVMPRLFRQAVATYFGGHEPAMNALNQPLVPADLAREHAAFEALHQARWHALRQLPTPQQVLHHLGVDGA